MPEGNTQICIPSSQKMMLGFFSPPLLLVLQKIHLYSWGEGKHSLGMNITGHIWDVWANHTTLSGTDLGVSHPTLFYKVARVNNFPWSRALCFFCFSILFHTARYDSLAFKMEVKLFNYHLKSIQPIENLSTTRWKKKQSQWKGSFFFFFLFPATMLQSAHL